MKINPKHFKFQIKSRRFIQQVWEKYYSIRKKKELTEFDKHFIKNLRQDLKINQYKLIVTHIPSNIKSEWLFKNDINKQKFNKQEYINKLLLTVKEKRKELKKVKEDSKKFDGAKYITVGGVFLSEKNINAISKHITVNNPMAPKHPRYKDKNYVGVELEFNQNVNMSQEQIAGKLKEAGLARYVDVTTDGSCGWEVRVLLLESDFEAPLTKIMNLLSELGFTTNDRCGTHVHLDMRNRDVKVAYENLFKTQKFLRKFLDRKRKRNTFCKMNKLSSFDEHAKIQDRYFSINTMSYDRHQTLEIRMHQGTLKASELVPWIKLLSKVVSYKSVVPVQVNTLKQAKTRFELEPELSKTLEKRIMTVFGRAVGA